MRTEAIEGSDGSDGTTVPDGPRVGPYRLIQQIGAGRAAYTGVLTPIIAMLLSTLFEDYRWSLLAAVGAGLAIAGMVVAMRARPSR